MHDQGGRLNRRRFVRHPATLTIRCRKKGHVESSLNEMRDISIGGMFFVSPESYSPGELVEMEIPVLTLRNKINGEIIWSSPSGLKPFRQFAIGLKFLNRQMLFMVRMIEQLCCIEKYRESQARQCGRTLSGDAAAREWIRMCACHFPSA